jgi:hypothetical protein
VRDLLHDSGRSYRLLPRLFSPSGGLGVYFLDELDDPLVLLLGGKMLPAG